MASATTQSLPEHPESMSGVAPDAGLVFESLVAHVIGPIRLAAIEAMLWIEEPISTTLLTSVLEGLEVDGELYPGRISYHLRALAQYGLIEVVARRPVRGAHENYYFFTAP